MAAEGNVKIILPRTHVQIDPAYGPLFFLAGPIRGGGDWQRWCCREIEKRLPQFYAAVPCHWNEFHPLWRYRANGDETTFPRQLNWERHYIREAAVRGCLLFWLPCEHPTAKHPGPEPYAMDTRGELGRWSVHLAHDPALRVVVGAEAGFHGLNQIQRNINADLGYDFPIHDTCEKTIEAALALLR